jgi:hypothetical protein
MIRQTVCLSFVLCVSLFPDQGKAQTRQFLDAPVVKSQLRVRWNASLKVMQWAADNDGTFRSFPASAAFLTKSSVYVAYPHLNPLATQATVTSVAVADPAYANITTLLNAITGAISTAIPGAAIGTTNAPGVANKAAEPNEVCPDPSGDIQKFRKDLDLDPPSDLAKTVATWPGIVDASFGAGKPGAGAVGDGITEINKLVTKLGNDISAAQKDWTTITKCSTTATDDVKRAVYQAVSLYDPNLRLQQLTALQTAARQLSDSLMKQFGMPDNWTGPNLTDYVISAEIAPTFMDMQNVTVKVVSLTLKVDNTTSALTTDQQAAGSTTFSVRKYSTMTTEIGVGVVFGTIKQPIYGTSMNAAGQTIVAKKSDQSLSTNGAVLANFVCRCGTGLLVPMLQVGASASKDLPALLVGAGIRLFGLGKGDFALSGGGMIAWYKDLQKLKVGDEVTGTNDITSDLGLITLPKVGGYLGIEYKF